MEVIKFQGRGKAYTIHVGEDLFGSLYVLRRWFSLTSKRGGSKMHHNVTPDEVERLIGMVVARRKAHGYRIVEDGRDTRMEVDHGFWKMGSLGRVAKVDSDGACPDSIS